MSVGRDKSLRLIDLTKGKIIAVQNLGIQEPKEVRYSPDGTIFAVLFDSEVVLHDAASAEPRYRIALPDSVVKFVSFSFAKSVGITSETGGAYCLAIGCEGGMLLLADMTGSSIASVQTGHAGRVRCVAASENSGLIFTVGADAVVHVWRTADLLCQRPTGSRQAANFTESGCLPLQRLVSAQGFRGTCITLIEGSVPRKSRDDALFIAASDSHAHTSIGAFSAASSAATTSVCSEDSKSKVTDRVATSGKFSQANTGIEGKKKNKKQVKAAVGALPWVPAASRAISEPVSCTDTAAAVIPESGGKRKRKVAFAAEI